MRRVVPKGGSESERVGEQGGGEIDRSWVGGGGGELMEGAALPH